MKSVQFMLLTIAVLGGCYLVSAQTWTQTSAPNNDWQRVASSADGSRLVAVVTGGGIYTSTNSGNTWTSNNVPKKQWASVSSSADGNKLFAVANSGGGIYTSSDAGNTWTSNNMGPSFPNWWSWSSTASSADGNKLLAASGFNILTSTNFGVAWTSNTVLSGYTIASCASSADGTKLIVGLNSGTISLSTNSGMTWEQTMKSGGWWSVASSADGSKLMAYTPSEGDSPGVFTSTNYGATWALSKVISNRGQQFVASSADGLKLAIADGAGDIYTSTNSGTSWMSNNVPNSWNSIASSADGNELIATVQGGGIWISHTMPSPTLNITPSNGSFTLSWIVPSTNFVLQQSSDLSSWTDVTNTPTLNLTNLQDEVVLSPTNGSGFYRLESR